MQENYRYLLTKPTGRVFHPDFKPELTPRQMLQMGCSGGIHDGLPEGIPQELVWKSNPFSGTARPGVELFWGQRIQTLVLLAARGMDLS